MILVTGASGTIGSALVRLLADRGVRFRAMTRDPERLTGDFEVVRGDFEDPESVRQALKGVDTVFLLSAPGGTIAQHDLALLAEAHDVSRVVKVSAMCTGEPGFEATSGWHLPGEQALRSDGDREFTILRPSAFASNSLMWQPQIQAGQPIPTYYGDGGIGVVDPRDVAAVAVEALLTNQHNGQIYTLTGPDILSTAQQAETLGEVLGRTLEVVDVPTEQLRAGMLAQGLDEAAVDLAMAGYDIVRQGGAAFVTDDVQRVLGRPATPFQTWVRDNRERFALRY